MSQYSKDVEHFASVKARYGEPWAAIDPESAARMYTQNRFRTGLDIARYTAKIMREDMAAYDRDTSNFTQSLGTWHGFIAQQKMISVKRHFGDTKGKYLYMSGWMVAATRSEFGPLPDQSMHEKTVVPSLIEEQYQFLKQADAWELNPLFHQLDEAREAGDSAKEKELIEQIDNYESHVVPIIADIDAGFGNAEATYLLARKMIEAGACALQIENQVADEKQCGHQDGKVTVPHVDFAAKLNAIRYAFLELGVDDGIIVARTDSEGAGLTKQIAVSHEQGDLGDQYNSFLEGEEVNDLSQVKDGDVLVKTGGKTIIPKQLPNGLYEFRKGTNVDRVVLDCITALRNGADLLWIETPTPDVNHIGHMVERIRAEEPTAKLVYNNSPSFNWTLNFRQQVYDQWADEGKDVSGYDRDDLMNSKYDNDPISDAAEDVARNFQKEGSAKAGIFHHLVTLPTYHTVALSTDDLVKGYFGEEAMNAYASGVQRREIREGIPTVKHQTMAGTDIGDDHKEYFGGDNALKAGGKKNTMSQFG